MQFGLKVTLDIKVEIWMGIGLETKIESDGEIEAEVEVGIESKVHKKGIMKKNLNRSGDTDGYGRGHSIERKVINATTI